MKNFIMWMLLLNLACAAISAEAALIAEATSMSATLSTEGCLKQKNNGCVYLDVSNDYIQSLAILLDVPGKLRQPSTAPDAVGAHIVVFKPSERPASIELGQSFSFTVKEVKAISVATSGSRIKQWVVCVDAPQLENLRSQYGCPAMIEGGFYIVIGQQVPCGPVEEVEVLSLHNFSDAPYLPCSTKGDFTVHGPIEMLNTAAKVHAVGKLRMQNNGFTYLDVDNLYIEEASTKLPLQRLFSPIDTNKKAIGAHISVFYEEELLKNEIWHIAEIGQLFTFTIKEVRYVDRFTAKGKKRLWLLAVESPALQHLRQQYGLKPKLNGHDFHISIGNEALCD